jgi:hypothetical protein
MIKHTLRRLLPTASSQSEPAVRLSRREMLGITGLLVLAAPAMLQPSEVAASVIKAPPVPDELKSEAVKTPFKPEEHDAEIVDIQYRLGRHRRGHRHFHCHWRGRGRWRRRHRVCHSQWHRHPHH